MRPVFTWSYRALPPDAARLFRLLGLHPGPDFSDTAAAALAGVDVRTARRLLDVVAAAHMVEQTASDRFRLHDLLRAYAGDQARLEQTPHEREEALRRVLIWYLHTADAVQAMQWYEAERDNLVAAVRAAATSGLDRITWQLAVVLRAVYMTNNPYAQPSATSHHDGRSQTAKVRDHLMDAVTSVLLPSPSGPASCCCTKKRTRGTIVAPCQNRVLYGDEIRSSPTYLSSAASCVIHPRTCAQS